MHPLVSAIVPFYNVEEFLDACLASIAAQTYDNFECILVDDGSPDGSRAIAERWAARDSRFRIITQENKGLGAARNTGTAHSSGEYLIYVDSDDLLAPRAFEQFVTSLEQSGSDFAGAHIWRLPLTRPIEGSWAHSEPFAEFRQRTSIREIPLLMRDRMAWNKMWRREFWEKGEFSWPEMKFEDFPVTIRAHLEAEAVDTLPDPVYVWRERPVGQSISGQGKALDNVSDRVKAAKMVLTTVDAKATPEVRELVHSHLVDVDLREVMSSFISGHADDQGAIEGLAHELAQAIDPSLVGLANADMQKAYRAARDNDMTTLRSLAQARFAPAPAATSKVAKAKKAPAALKRRADKVSAKLSTNRPRTAKLVGSHVDDFDVTYRVELPLSDRFKRAAVVKATLGDNELRVKSVVTKTGLLCDLKTDSRSIATRGGFQPLNLDVVSHGVHFGGPVQAHARELHGFHRAGYWVQGVNRGGKFGVERQRRVSTVSNARMHGRDLVLDCSVSGGELVIEQPWPRQEVAFPIVDGTVSVDLTDLVAHDPADNPVTKVASRRLRLRTSVGEENLFLLGDGVRLHAAEREVEILRSDDGSAFLVHRPL